MVMKNLMKFYLVYYSKIDKNKKLLYNIYMKRKNNIKF